VNITKEKIFGIHCASKLKLVPILERSRARARTHTHVYVPPLTSSTHASANCCVFARIARNCKRIGLRGTASATDVGSETSTLEEEQES
jgi:hypothetical protein